MHEWCWLSSHVLIGYLCTIFGEMSVQVNFHDLALSHLYWFKQVNWNKLWRLDRCCGFSANNFCPQITCRWSLPFIFPPTTVVVSSLISPFKEQFLPLGSGFHHHSSVLGALSNSHPTLLNLQPYPYYCILPTSIIHSYYCYTFVNLLVTLPCLSSFNY